MTSPRETAARLAASAALLGLLVGCGLGAEPVQDDGPTGVDRTGPTTGAPDLPDAPDRPDLPDVTALPGETVTVDLDGRPFRLHVPTGYDDSGPAALVVGLHGYTSRAEELDSYLGLAAAADERAFLRALPEGETNDAGDRYWNAVPGGCCDFYGAGTDDVEYLSRLLSTVQDSYDVDRVALVGPSNGGFMAQRFACDREDGVDGIAALAGPLP
ncbi:MAG TPA: hypothetical protein PKB06_06850, partial [Actinotalea sp.]|nr:hypothetical protein [Actinotalea sp.]